MLVYPRAGGGTKASRWRRCSARGLSPRRRGNQVRAGEDGPGEGSIPAQAGEPASTCSARSPTRVYPRAGGGTPVVKHDLRQHQGLSPRRRGNLDRRCDEALHRGSIPAQAGEPAASTDSSGSIRVYPRAGGGTVTLVWLMRPSQGLSPRRRGNQARGDGCFPARGSIPAQAGEPANYDGPPFKAKVYPRAGGGTESVLCVALSSEGLSPRRRGNRPAAVRRRGNLGSIPAQAGEPFSGSPTTS